MKKIKVEKECLDGMLVTAILETLKDLEVIDYNQDTEYRYNIEFERKGNRKNGKEFAILFDEGKVINGYWIKDTYRFNTHQQCTLIEIEDKREFENMLDEIYKNY